MKSILILLGILSTAPHAVVKALVRRAVFTPVDPPIGSIPYPPNVPSAYDTNYPTVPTGSALYRTYRPTAASAYGTNYPTATGDPYMTSNFSLSHSLSYATSRPSNTRTTTVMSTTRRTTIVTLVPYPRSIRPQTRPVPLLPVPIVPEPIIPEPRPFPCEIDTLFCNTLTSFSLCAPRLGEDSTRPVYIGDTAPGTVCRYGRIIRGPGGTCSPVGRLTCSEGGGRTFYLCAEGGELDLGPVPRGTECIAGNIFAIDADPQ